jgi:uncharacterized protein YgbK (DUF1537 family)
MEPARNNRLLIAFYGDDFTGSTDALESLNNAGIKTILFIDVPTTEQLRNYPGIQAIGIAGMTRNLSPSAMEAVLTPQFKALAILNPQHVHYKVCSTFDSSPAIGCIGKAIDIGMEVFKTRVVPLLVAAPKLGRYCLFGNLFARMGIGSEGKIYRLDRHPSMSKHPTTPAEESDLTLHLAKQTKKSIGLFDLPSLHQYQIEPFAIDFKTDEIVLFDAVNQGELETIGTIIDSQSNDHTPLFSVGSSGVEMALGAHWQKMGKARGELIWTKTEISTPILVLSGSCSPITSLQIKTALESGFEAIAVATENLANQVRQSTAIEFDTEVIKKYAADASVLLKKGKSVIIHTSLGSDDPRVYATDLIFSKKGLQKGDTAKLYGALLGNIARQIAAQTKLERIVVTGGDTSSYAARAMGIKSVEMIAPFSPGAPICSAEATNTAINKLQIIFKGGQVGKADFFVNAAK